MFYPAWIRLCLMNVFIVLNYSCGPLCSVHWMPMYGWWATVHWMPMGLGCSAPAASQHVPCVPPLPPALQSREASRAENISVRLQALPETVRVT